MRKLWKRILNTYEAWVNLKREIAIKMYLSRYSLERARATTAKSEQRLAQVAFDKIDEEGIDHREIMRIWLRSKEKPVPESSIPTEISRRWH